MKRLALAMVCVAGATPAGAQARCDLKPGHVLVSQALLELRSATETGFADERAKDLDAAYQQLVRALDSAGQAKNVAAWYYLGRYYVATNDIPGADSAFRQMVALAPGCADDANTWRRVLWVPVLNAGVAAWQVGNTDSALAAFRAAAAIYVAEPTALSYLATLFAGEDNVDSAVAYFQRAAAAAGDPKFAADRKNALFNVARLYHRARRLDDAARAYTTYLHDYPADVTARAGLVAVDLQTRRALAGQDTALLAAAGSADASELFTAGEEIRRAVPPRDTTTCAADSVACDSTARAAEATRLALALLRAGLAKNPYDRTALFTSTELALATADSSIAETTVTRLYGLDPSNRATVRLVAQVWRTSGNADSASRYAALADSLPLDVTVGALTVSSTGAALSGVVTNAQARGSDPVVLGVDFLSAAGTVVTTVTEAVPALDPGESRPFGLEAAGAGIAGWRYRVSAP